MSKENEPNPSADLVNVNVRNVPRDLRVKLKMWCVEHSVTMENVMVMLISELLNGGIAKTEADRIVALSKS